MFFFLVFGFCFKLQRVGLPDQEEGVEVEVVNQYSWGKYRE